jgi:hypothetical protein
MSSAAITFYKYFSLGIQLANIKPEGSYHTAGQNTLRDDPRRGRYGERTRAPIRRAFGEVRAAPCTRRAEAILHKLQLPSRQQGGKQNQE